MAGVAELGTLTDLPAAWWDVPLAAALRDRGRAVFEEQLVDTLLS